MRIANSFGYQNPYGAAVSNLAKIMLSGPTLDQQRASAALEDYRTAQTDKAAAETDLINQQKAAGGRLSGLFSAYPRQRANLNAQLPETYIEDEMLFQHELPESNPAYDARQAAATYFDRLPSEVMSSAAQMRGAEMQNIPALYRAFLANQPDTSDAAVARAVVGSGKLIGENDAVSLDDREGVAGRNAQNDIALQAAKPLTESQARAQVFSGLPTGTQNVAVGPSRSQVEGSEALALPAGPPRLAALFGNERTADETSPSGVRLVDRPGATGLPGVAPQSSSRTDVLGPTTGTKTMAQAAIAESGMTRTLIEQARALAEDDRNFGATGLLRQTVQDAIQQGDAFARTVGGNARSVQQDIVATGSDVGLERFDPNIPQLDAMMNILAYRLAKMNDPGGRLSERDFDIARRSLGGTGLLANRAEFLSRLDLFDNVLNANVDSARQSIGLPAGEAPPAAAPAEAAPVQRWERGPDGRPVRVRTGQQSGSVGGTGNAEPPFR